MKICIVTNYGMANSLVKRFVHQYDGHVRHVGQFKNPKCSKIIPKYDGEFPFIMEINMIGTSPLW